MNDRWLPYRRLVHFAVLGSALTMWQNAGGQDRLFAYPQKDQSPEQHRQDDRACHGWATQSTGFDPAAAARELNQIPLRAEAPPAVDTGSQGKRAAKGAARGSIVGVLTGAPIRGAVVGATTSTLFGRRKQRKAEQERAAWEQNQQQQIERERAAAEAEYRYGMEDHRRAFTACMQARGYLVR